MPTTIIFIFNLHGCSKYPDQAYFEHTDVASIPIRYILTIWKQQVYCLDKFKLYEFSKYTVQAYFDYMLDVANLMGADPELAAKEMKEVLNFEIQLANISLPRYIQG